MRRCRCYEGQRAETDRLDGVTGSLWYHNGQNQGKDNWVLKKVEVFGCGQLW
jgi:hypothetical protein